MNRNFSWIRFILFWVLIAAGALLMITGTVLWFDIFLPVVAILGALKFRGDWRKDHPKEVER